MPRVPSSLELLASWLRLHTGTPSHQLAIHLFPVVRPEMFLRHSGAYAAGRRDRSSLFLRAARQLPGTFASLIFTWLPGTPHRCQRSLSQFESHDYRRIADNAKGTRSPELWASCVVLLYDPTYRLPGVVVLHCLVVSPPRLRMAPSAALPMSEPRKANMRFKG